MNKTKRASVSGSLFAKQLTLTPLHNGNIQRTTSRYITDTGQTHTVGNLDFASNTFYREFTDSVEPTESALSLPDAKGAGRVRDLRKAA